MEFDEGRKLAPMQASKWLKLPILMEENELENLFHFLGDFKLYQTSGVLPIGGGLVEKADFLKIYSDYLSALKKGQIPNENLFRPYFSAVMTLTDEALFAVPVEGNQQVIRIRRPVVQLQNHRFDYSEIDGEYRSMVYGLESVLWGIQFSYPQICQDAKTKEVEQVKDSPEFPNTRLFRSIQKWSREHTLPTPITAKGVKTNLPIRLGKGCFSWINNHPQLIKKGLRVG